MKRPKKLWRFNVHHEMESHEIGEDCAPQLVTSNFYGVLWRCRHHGDYGPDFSGYETRERGKAEGVDMLRSDILSLIARWESLTGKTWGQS